MRERGKEIKDIIVASRIFASENNSKRSCSLFFLHSLSLSLSLLYIKYIINFLFV